MSEETKPEVNPDDPTKTTEPESNELTPEELNGVSGGTGAVEGGGAIKRMGWDVKAARIN
jgi:hypothetical protein